MTPRPNILYIHGAHSKFDPTNPKVVGLATLGTIAPFTYNTTNSFEFIMAKLLKASEGIDDLVWAGSSLGAFYAALISELVPAPTVLFNPLMNPCEFAASQMRGWCSDMLSTGKLGQIIRDSYPHSVFVDPNQPREFAPLVLLDEGDELFDSKETLKRLSGWPVAIFQGGSHRFDHIDLALPIIEQYLNHCSTVTQFND